MKVLIVEDEVLIATYLEALVVGFGHQVSAVAASASEAIENAAVHAPDAALIDIRLTGGASGSDFAHVLYVRQGLRCIFLSGNLDNATRRALGPCKPIDFVDKPILPVMLRRALQTAERLVAR
jgi:two-component system, response regulator PdtaR